METFVAISHIIIAVLLIVLVLVQDSKGGGFGTGMATSNSVFGATGAATLAQKATTVIAVVFGVTCVALTILSARGSKSLMDSVPAAAVPQNPTSPSSTTTSTSTTQVPTK